MRQILQNGDMKGALPWIVLVAIFALLIAAGRALKALTHRHVDYKRRRERRWAELPGVLAAGVALVLLSPRLGGRWAIDIGVAAYAAWKLFADVVIIGVPDKAVSEPPGRSS
jgi:hypothetical protein